MSDMSESELIRNIIKRLSEADAMAQTIPEPEASPIEQPEVDQDIEDVMTEPARGGPDDEEIGGLISDMDIDDAPTFAAAFDTLRKGDSITDPAQHAALAMAFAKMMTVDPSTVQRVINRLRALYKQGAGYQVNA